MRGKSEGRSPKVEGRPKPESRNPNFAPRSTATPFDSADLITRSNSCFWPSAFSCLSWLILNAGRATFGFHPSGLGLRLFFGLRPSDFGRSLVGLWILLWFGGVNSSLGATNLIAADDIPPLRPPRGE